MIRRHRLLATFRWRPDRMTHANFVTVVARLPPVVPRFVPPTAGSSLGQLLQTAAAIKKFAEEPDNVRDRRFVRF
jgi:hypothetical protein